MPDNAEAKKPERSSRRRELIERLIFYPIIVVLATLLIISLRGAGYERHKRTHCMVNLKVMGMKLGEYSEEHDKAFPPDLQTLYDHYCLDTECYICPGSGKKPAEDAKPTDYASMTPAQIAPENMSYCYVAGLKSTDPENYIVIFEPDGNHNMEGINVFYVGQNVVWQTDIKAIHEQLEKQEKELKAQGREMRIIRPGEPDKK